MSWNSLFGNKSIEQIAPHTGQSKRLCRAPYWLLIVLVDDSDDQAIDGRINLVIEVVMRGGGTVLNVVSTIVVAAWVEIAENAFPVQPVESDVLSALSDVKGFSRGCFGYWTCIPIMQIKTSMMLRWGVNILSFESALSQVFACPQHKFIRFTSSEYVKS
jgi:hypothetical protein